MKSHPIARAVLTTLGCTLTSMAIPVLVVSVFKVQESHQASLTWYAIFSALFIAPPIETLLFQRLPYTFASSKRLPLTLTLALMSVPFSLAHSFRGVDAMIETFLGGVALAALYIYWATQSRRLAFWTTVTAHFLHNMATILFMLNSGVRPQSGI